MVRAGQTYLFRGKHFVRYSNDSYDYVDESYPRSLSENIDGLPDLTGWLDGVDAAFHVESTDENETGKTYYVKGDKFLIIT